MGNIRRQIRQAMSGANLRSQIVSGLRMKLLKPETILEYVPSEGLVCDLACRFGLVSVAAALQNPETQVIGNDLDEARIKSNQVLYRRVPNVTFGVGDLLNFSPEKKAAAITLIDSTHYFRPEVQLSILKNVWSAISEGGVLILRDVVDDGSLRYNWNRIHEKVMVEKVKWTKTHEAMNWFLTPQERQLGKSRLTIPIPIGLLRMALAPVSAIDYVQNFREKLSSLNNDKVVSNHEACRDFSIKLTTFADGLAKTAWE